MRVTRIPGDHDDIGDRPCRVWCSEVEILDWIVADDFRRVVETADGARFGSVRIDMQPDASEPAEEAAMHLCGMFVVEPKPEAPDIEIVETQKAEPALTSAKSDWSRLNDRVAQKHSRKTRK